MLQPRRRSPRISSGVCSSASGVPGSRYLPSRAADEHRLEADRADDAFGEGDGLLIVACDRDADRTAGAVGVVGQLPIADRVERAMRALAAAWRWPAAPPCSLTHCTMASPSRRAIGLQMSRTSGLLARARPCVFPISSSAAYGTTITTTSPKAMACSTGPAWASGPRRAAISLEILGMARREHHRIARLDAQAPSAPMRPAPTEPILSGAAGGVWAQRAGPVPRTPIQVRPQQDGANAGGRDQRSHSLPCVPPRPRRCGGRSTPLSLISITPAASPPLAAAPWSPPGESCLTYRTSRARRGRGRRRWAP